MAFRLPAHHDPPARKEAALLQDEAHVVAVGGKPDKPRTGAWIGPARNTGATGDLPEVPADRVRMAGPPGAQRHVRLAARQVERI